MVRVALVREAAPIYTAQGPADVAQLARELLTDRDRETFLVLCLDTKLRVSAAHTAAVGGLDHCTIDPRGVFTAALLANAASVVLAHNHPSGDPTPSPQDRAMTRRLCRAGDILGIPVEDHVIVGHDEVYSFRGAGDEGRGGEVEQRLRVRLPGREPGADGNAAARGGGAGIRPHCPGRRIAQSRPCRRRSEACRDAIIGDGRTRAWPSWFCTLRRMAACTCRPRSWRQLGWATWSSSISSPAHLRCGRPPQKTAPR